VDVYRLPVRGPNAFADALSSLIAENVEALVLVDDGMLIANAQEFGAMSSAQRLASVGFSEFARGGGLLGYGVNFPAMFSRAAILVDRLLKGAKPGDLPIEQATKFEMVVI
jgi:putative tryptophan/tyrosine transport system substrate-binding protein